MMEKRVLYGSMKNKFSPGILQKPLVLRVLLFIVCFVVLSGGVGSWIVNNKKLLFEFHFWIYGGAGKVILFGLVSFLLQTRDKILSIPVRRVSKRNVVFGLSVIANVLLFFLASGYLLEHHTFSEAPALSLATHATVLMVGGSLVLALFGGEFLIKVMTRFRKEFFISFALSISFYFAFSFIFGLWPYLSGAVLFAVVKMLNLTFDTVKVVPPLTIQIPQFAVTIGQYCSGIESLFLISILYLLIGHIEWPRLRKSRYFLYFPPLLIGMFLLNIVRVYLIIIAGVLTTPELAARLFHTYLGMLLFMGYFFIFWKYAKTQLLLVTHKGEYEKI